jgi:hypothetical protein
MVSSDAQVHVDEVAHQLYQIINQRLNDGVRLVPRDVEQIAMNETGLSTDVVHRGLARMESLYAKNLQYLGYQPYFSIFE